MYWPVGIDHGQDVVIGVKLVAVLDQVIDNVSHHGWWNPLASVNAAVDPECRGVLQASAYPQNLERIKI